MDCCKSVGSFDPSLEVFTRLLHLDWYVLQNVEGIFDQGLNHAPIEDSKTTVSLVLGSDPPPVTGSEGFELDSSVGVPTEVESLSEQQL